MLVQLDSDCCSVRNLKPPRPSTHRSQCSQCSTMSIHPRRIRLKPWLLAQVNSGRYPGLQWLGSEQRLFQIPWKHATRHTPMSEEENTIFKAWAVETGKYQEGVDEPDPAKWKANLRCALNKSREFRLRFDGTKETPLRPYKIYEVCDGTGAADGAEDEDEEMPDLTDLSIKPRIEPASFPPFGSAQVIPMPLLPLTSELQPRGSMADPGSFDPAGLQNLNPRSSTQPECMEASSMESVQNQSDHQNQQSCKYDLLSSVPLTDLDLKFWYRGRAMGSLTVSNPQGCRLYYGHLEPTPEQVDLFGPVSLQQVLFPGTAEIQNQKQRFYTDALLDVMDRGLILEIQQQDIYAIRLCQCKVFWSGPGIPELGPPNPMERERRIRVFSLNDFLQGLILFQKGEAANPPPFDVFFCFGEDWPDRKPKEKKLIMVQVVPVVARILTEMFSGELAWSTDSIRLQISNPDVKDQTVEQFKELQRLLQNQLGPTGPWAPAGSLEAPTGFSMGTS
ncbi:PREDICTED: interferon regulatory factor 5 isoform X1 [Poecilia mexicana]|uniref:interferon regulatory factor 5 isoform X1 n=1 Tax=Poecilia mexicana TaxID=48701 RepID=UPI00072E0E09|nr:PREDICTED: interferon regulatory factor 5 isoform X1 [Poecilia mexicana]